MTFEEWWPSVGQTIGKIAAKLAWDKQGERIAKLEGDICIMVQKAADQHRPAYDEQQSRIDELENEQAAWRMFTKEAEQTLAGADKKIARLLHEIERLKRDAWQDGTHPKQIDYGPNEV